MKTKYIVNNITGQTINSQPLDPKYKVYTALLTQSGGDVLEQLDYSTLTQNVIKGVTYIITTDIGADFINVGAPNNNTGTSFVAINNEIPNSWGENNAAMLVFNTGTPIATVLENTIGNIWFTYDSVGMYSCYSNELFIFNKTWVTQVIILGTGGPAYRGAMYLDAPNRVGIQTELDVDVPSDNLLYNTPIEIRVYN
jgi:hypothetical protein